MYRKHGRYKESLMKRVIHLPNFLRFFAVEDEIEIYIIYITKGNY